MTSKGTPYNEVTIKMHGDITAVTAALGDLIIIHGRKQISSIRTTAISKKRKWTSSRKGICRMPAVRVQNNAIRPKNLIKLCRNGPTCMEGICTKKEAETS